MRYGQIRRYDVANGPGVRTTLFVTGCPLHCPGCFNAEYQPFDAGEPWTDETKAQLLGYLDDPHVAGLSVLGGEPLLQDEQLLALLKEAHARPGKNIWMWTGLVYEQLDERQKQLLSYVDVLVDGPFIQAQRDLKLQFRGSANQRMIDLNKTRAAGEIVLWESGYANL